MTENIGLFLSQLIALERPKYSHGRGWSLDRINNSKIKLPVDIDGNPNWQLMEDYINEIKYTK